MSEVIIIFAALAICLVLFFLVLIFHDPVIYKDKYELRYNNGFWLKDKKTGELFFRGECTDYRWIDYQTKSKVDYYKEKELISAEYHLKEISFIPTPPF